MLIGDGEGEGGEERWRVVWDGSARSGWMAMGSVYSGMGKVGVSIE